MPNHMSSLGFQMSTADDFGQWAAQAAQNGRVFSLPTGYYIHWEVGHGIELWAQADLNRELIWLNPHFNGQPGMRVGLVGRVPRHETPLEGAFYGWADPTDDTNPASGAYPFVFDMPDALLQGDLELPTIQAVQIAAFAHRLDGYENEEAYLAAQEGSIPYAPESFIPTGLFVAEEEPSPPASAVFTGHILATNERENPLTGNRFYWARVQTLGGEVDVVADPEVVVGRLVVGGIVSGAFWLSGRVVPSNP